MSSRKNQNSLLFLTTLGVYLGLLIVGGAAPQVFAHSATTRGFEISDEIEVKDDLDTKPDPTKQELDEAIEEYAKRIENFVKNLKKLHSIEEFSSSWNTFESEHTSFSPCPSTGIREAIDKTGHIDRWIVPTIIEANFIVENFTSLADCLPNNSFADRTQASQVRIKLKFDKAELLHELSIKLTSADRARLLHEGLLAAFNRYEIEKDADYELNRVLLKHTLLTFSDDQVFMVTRLPRAGLDALLLAKNAK